jgi:hypothetical protein
MILVIGASGYREKQEMHAAMSEMSAVEVPQRVPEERYAYYRRCQIFRKGGVQCKAPAEKGSHICYAHAGQLAMAVRWERERRAVLTEAVAQMRKRGKPDCEMADLFMDFKGINVTLAVMMQAVIDGRIDCKTAGRLVVQLQTVSKLLWMLHRKGREGRKEKRVSPQICADERRLKTRTTPLINTDGTDLKRSENQNLTVEARRRGEKPNTERNWDAIRLTSHEHERMRIALVTEVLAIANGRGWGYAPPELLRAA